MHRRTLWPVPALRVDQSRVERWLTWVRVIGVLFAVPAVLTTPYWPGRGEQVFVWAVTCFFVVGTVVVWLCNRRVGTRRGRARLSVATTMFDVAVVSGYVLGFAFEQPYVTWSLAVTLPIAGALRFGARGAVALAAAAIVLFVAQSLLRHQYVDQPMLSAQIYAAGLIALIAGAVAVLVESLDRQNAAYRDQALQLAEANRVRDRLLDVTSHEFRGSLAAIGSSAATVREHRARLSGERADRLLLSVEAQVGQLLRLVEDLLVTAESPDGVLELSPRWQPVQASVDVALDAAARHRNGHSVEVYVEPMSYELDHDRFSQVLRNLVENAYKYSPGAGTVTVSVERVSHGVEMRVADHGPGIPPQLREQLFEPYRRGEGEQAAGSGLGLYVVHRIVTAAGGSVDVRSSSAGSEFVVRWPCSASEALRPVSSDAEEPDGGDGKLFG